jgi:hypothetical protein
VVAGIGFEEEEGFFGSGTGVFVSEKEITMFSASFVQLELTPVVDSNALACGELGVYIFRRSCR